MNFIKVKRNNLLNSIYSSVSLDFRFKETPYVNFFTDPELSSSLYQINPTNQQSACVPRDRPIYSRIGSKNNIYYFRIGRLSTCALNDARK